MSNPTKDCPRCFGKGREGVGAYSEACWDCGGTGRVADTKPSGSTLEENITQLVNKFIWKWVPDYYSHLIDSDDNDGEKLRQALLSLYQKELVDELRWLRKDDFFKHCQGCSCDAAKLIDGRIEDLTLPIIKLTEEQP